MLTQISAVSSALQSVAVGLVNEHLHHCVADAVRDGDGGEEKLDEASRVIARLVKS